MSLKKIILLLLIFVGSIPARSAFALDTLTVKINEKEEKLEGRIIAEDIEGNLVLEERDGQWYKIEKANIRSRSADTKIFVPFTQDEMISILEKEYPAPFRVLKTKQYLIVYDTSTAYAQWCGTMLERLQATFLHQWKKKGLAIHEPEFPLVAVLFADRKDFILCTKHEVADIGEQIAAYYNFNTNRIVFSDLTGFEKKFEGPNRLSRSQIQEFLARPGAAPSISAFIHEATHQIAFNSGMHQRYASCPLWLSEGIAMFYETPDISSTKGWNASAKINPVRMKDLIAFMDKNPRDTLRLLICNDEPLRDPENIQAYYATAWAMVYYLNTKKQKDFLKYLQLISEKSPFDSDSAEIRLEEFESIFGDNWTQLYQDFTKFVYNGCK